VVFGGHTIAETTEALRALETSHPPVYYLPLPDVQTGVLRASDRTTICEWKGVAQYYDVLVEDFVANSAAWGYSNPTPAFQAVRDHVAFYAHLMDACYVDGERVSSQAGGFYGGWVTSNIVGPFKGGPGTQGW
jgi:uncharacterized protein (DUF427 family)